MTALAPLRWLLWLTLAVGLLCLADAAWLELRPESPSVEGARVPDLPDLESFAILGMLAAGAVCFLPSALGLWALRQRRPAVALLFLMLSLASCVCSLVLMLGSAGVEASVNRMSWLVVAIPAWWATMILLGTARPAIARLGLSPGWAAGTRGALLLLVAALLSFTFWSSWRSPAAERALARLHRGQSWREVVLATETICPMGRAEVMKGVMWLDCPAATLGATPLVTTSIELRFGDDQLVGWRRRPVLEFPR